MTWLGYSPVGPISWWMRHHRASGPFVVLGFFLFLGQEYGQLAPCVELQRRIQAERAHRKENSCQTMNYCSVTRRVSFWGVDQEVGSVSRITHRCTHAYIYMHFGWTCVWAHTCTHGITKSRVSPLLASGLSLAIFYTSQCQIIQCMLSQNEGKPTDCPRYRETFTFLATIRREGRAKKFRPSRNAILSLAGALRGLRGALWQQRGSAVQTPHILGLTSVNRAGGFTRARRSLRGSKLPQSHCEGLSPGGLLALWQKDGQPSPPPSVVLCL